MQVDGSELIFSFLHKDVRKYLASFLEYYDLHYVKTTLEHVMVDEMLFCDEFICYAIKHGYLNQLKWIVNYIPGFEWNRYPWNQHLYLNCSYVARKGQWKILQWLRFQECGWGDNLCDEVAQEGLLDVLKWVRNPPFGSPAPWHKLTCAWAANSGHLEVLKWLRENGCPWDENTCSFAAEDGHLNIIQWARAQVPPAPWDGNTCLFAARMGRLDVLKWCFENRAPCCLQVIREEAFHYDQMLVYQWITEKLRHRQILVL